MRPRHLYLALFTYYALSGGRFTAPFLEHELNFQEQWMVSCALALQILIGSVCSSYFGILADKWDANTERCHGRLRIMYVGLAVSTVATLMHLIASEADANQESEEVHISTNYLIFHLSVRCIFAIGVSATSPVLNGLTLARLERDGRHANEFGKERLYGAISWGVANSCFGFAIDAWGFKVLYVTTVLSFIGCGLAFYMYVRADDEMIATASVNRYVQDTEGDEQCTNDTIEECTDDSTQLDFKGNKVNMFEGKKFSDENFDLNTTSNLQADHTDDKHTLQQFSFLFVLKTVYNQPLLALNISYIIALFTLYIGMSVVENLIFLYFEFLGGSDTLCGVTVAVTVLFELPIFHFAHDILQWMKSPVWMFQWGCLAYVVRVVGYSVVPESHAPWVLLLEPLHGVTIGFVLTGSVVFVDSLMPRGYESSGQGFLSSIMGLGQFVGLCVGGALEGRVLYRVLASIVALGSLVLAIGHRLSVRPAEVEGNSTSNGLELKKKQAKRSYSK